MLAAASRDSVLTLRRVERQQQLIEVLVARGRRMTIAELAAVTDVAPRTVARDLERLRSSGVPIDVKPGRDGGAALHRVGRIEPVSFDLSEIAALLASLAAVGPTVSESAASAMGKLTAALHDR